jgi:hypothetical protein
MRLQIVLDRFLIRIQLVAILWQPKLFGLVLKPLSDMWTQHNKKNLVRLSATVTPKFFPLYHFFPLFSPLFFHLPQRFLLNTPSIPHYHYKISFSISTINFLSTNNYSWTHSTVFRVMNSDTLDLGGERRGPTRRGRYRGHRCGHRVPPYSRHARGGGAVASTAAVSLTRRLALLALPLS